MWAGELLKYLLSEGRDVDGWREGQGSNIHEQYILTNRQDCLTVRSIRIIRYGTQPRSCLLFTFRLPCCLAYMFSTLFHAQLLHTWSVLSENEEKDPPL